MRPTVLIVDDDQVRCRRIMEKCGPEFDTEFEVLDGGEPIVSEAEALAKIQTHRPQRILIADRYLPLVWQLPDDQRLNVIVASKLARDSMDYLQTKGVIHFGDKIGYGKCLRWECGCLERSEEEEGLQGNVY